MVRAEAWREAQIAALHARGDCYVSLHRGEGWGYPLFEAATRGKPVIATGYSGPVDFLAPNAHCLVRHTLTSVRQPYAYYRPSMNWAEPDIAHATELMRAVHTKPNEARQRAADAAKRLVGDFSLEAIGQRAKRRLLDLLRRTDNAKWERLEHTQRTVHFRPPSPIPGEWFDADYFENGVKSNWKNGYHWRDFAGLFRGTAQFLVKMFPEAGSFLDAGCAKGFLVKSLRALGKQAWGFDFSPWALANAEAEARPYIQLAAAEDVRYDRKFDALLAFDLLAHLTEAQILAFLRNSCEWTRAGLLAIIPTYDQPQAELPDDHDLSHITRQTRQWWHERFLDCGWCQDQLHREMQRLCQSHELAVRMGWSIYLYSPGKR
jgi:2-polyprenyl-3-methyl-5-hydroxy-6-metoxy-1,4-benzoquinol methylase